MPRDARRSVLAALCLVMMVVLLLTFLSRQAGMSSADGVPASEAEAAGTSAAGSARGGDSSSQPQEVAGSNERAPRRPAASPPPMRRVLRGTVREAKTHAPIASAPVALLRTPQASSLYANRVQPEILATSESGPDGTYRFEVPEAAAEACSLFVRARADGYGHSAFLVQEDESGGPLTLDVELVPPSHLAGVVVDEAGTPLEGVELGGELWSGGLSTGGWSMTSFVSQAITGPDGKFRLEHLPSSAGVLLPLRAEGFADATSEYLRMPREDVRLVMRRAQAGLRVLVLDHDGVPQPLQTVDVSESAAPSGGVWPYSSQRRTDQNGIAEFSHLPAGPFMVAAFSRRPDRSWRSEQVTLMPGEVQEVTARYPTPAVIRGTFVDADTSRGIALVKLYRHPERSAGPDEVVASSDAEGRFQVEVSGFTVDSHAASAAEHRFMADIPLPYIPRQIVEQTSPGISLNGSHLSLSGLRYGEVHEVTIALRRGEVLQGRVVQADGTSPMADAIFEGMANGTPLRFQTDAAGRFTLPLSLPATLAIVATNPPTGEYLLEERKVGVKTPHLEFRARREATVKGIVYAPDNQPAAGAWVDVAVQVPDHLRRLWRPRNNSAVAETDGTFSISLAPLGPVQISATGDETRSKTSSRATLPELTIEPGAVIEGLELRLVEGRSLPVRVVDDLGTPLQGATVFIPLSVRRGVHIPEFRTGQTDEHGLALVNGLPDDTALTEISAEKEGYQPVQIDRPGIVTSEHMEEFRIVLRKSGQLTLHARADGQAVPNFSATLWQLERMTQLGEPFRLPPRSSLGSGQVAFLDLPAGRYRAEVAALDQQGKLAGQSGVLDFRLDPSSSEPVVVELQPALALAGRVVDPDRRPVEGASVVLLNSPGYLYIEGTNARTGNTRISDAGGRFSFTPMIPGTYRLAAFKERHATEGVTAVTVTGKDHEEVELVLGKPGRVHGVVTGADGKPAAGVDIRAMPDGMVPGVFLSLATTVTTTSAGEYGLLLQPRAWVLVVQLPGESMQITKKVALAAGAEHRIDFDLSTAVVLEGRLLLNDAPATAERVVLRSGDGLPNTLRLDSQGRFQEKLLPGAYTFAIPSGDGFGWLSLSTPFALPAEPKKQERDFAFQTVPMDLWIAGVAPEDLGRTMLTLRQRLEGQFETTVRDRQSLRQDRWRALEVPIGEYFARIERDGRTVAESGWVRVEEGAPNLLMVEETAEE